MKFVSESSLNYELSPSNYDNSPSNYDNSISNYDNSPSNYDNSESNYDKSSSNYSNGASGERRLLLEKDAGMCRVGYYVRADNGVINFFSTDGKRLLYNPKEGIGIFHGENGDFCGVLAMVQGDYVLALTDAGRKILLFAAPYWVSHESGPSCILGKVHIEN